MKQPDLSLKDNAVKSAGKTVFEALQMKHPEQTKPHPDSFILCKDLPTFNGISLLSLVSMFFDVALSLRS